MTKTMVSSKMGDKTVEKVEEYADRKGISRSQAVEELARKALSIENEDKIVLSPDGGSIIEEKVTQTTEEQTDQLETRLQSSSTNQQFQILALGLAFLWVMAYYEATVGTIPTVVTGFLVIAANLVPLYREWSK